MYNLKRRPTYYFSEGLLLVYGSPLLDIIIRGPSADKLLAKYGLGANDSIFAQEKHLPLFESVQEERCADAAQYAAGGTALNTARVVQWVLRSPRVTSFLGGIGRDRHGEILQRMTDSAGVSALFQFSDTLATGTCVTLCTGQHRSMVSRQAAAACFTEAHLELPANWRRVEHARFFYTVCFALATSQSVMFRLARHAAETKKTFALNLSAPFLCAKFKEPMADLLPYVDYLFCNESEADEFAVVHNFSTSDRKSTAVKMATWTKVNRGLDRVVVITQGPDPVIVATGNTLTEFPVRPVSSELIKDTSGAGDAFVGGFLAKLVGKGSLADCVRCGIHASSTVLRHVGCSLPESPGVSRE